MQPELQTIIKQYNAAPEPVQQAIFYGDIGKTIGEIGTAYGLTDAQSKQLENHIVLTLLLIVPRSELDAFIATVATEPNTARSIAFLVDTLLIAPTFERISLDAPATPLPTASGSDSDSYQPLGQDALLNR